MKFMIVEKTDKNSNEFTMILAIIKSRMYLSYPKLEWNNTQDMLDSLYLLITLPLSKVHFSTLKCEINFLRFIVN